MARRSSALPILLCGFAVLAASVGVAATAFMRRSATPPTAPQTSVVTTLNVNQKSDDVLAKGLNEEERALLWDIEHHGNLLNKFGFKAVADALARADEQGLLEAFAVEFSGRIPTRNQ